MMEEQQTEQHLIKGQEVSAEKSGTCSGGCAKVVFVLGGLFTMVVGLFVALMIYGSGTANTKLDEYFKFASSASLDEIAKTFHSSLTDAADPVRLAMLIKAVPTHYGAFKNVEINGFSFSDEYKNSMRLRDYKGNAVFEKGTIPIELSFVNEELLAFTISSGEAVKPLLKLLTIPADLSPYKEKAEKLMRALLSGKAEEAFKLMSKPLQETIGKVGVTQHCKNFVSNGTLKNVEFIKVLDNAEDSDELILLYKCSIGKHVTAGHVTFKFSGLNSFLIGYEIPSSKAKP